MTTSQMMVLALHWLM